MCDPVTMMTMGTAPLSTALNVDPTLGIARSLLS